MALTINNFCGFETGGDEEATSGTTGTPAYEETTVRTGDYSLKMSNAATVEWRIVPFEDVASAGDDQIFGFYVRFHTGVTPSSDFEFFRARSANTTVVSISLSTIGELIVGYNAGSADTISGALSIDTWYRIEVKWQNVISGTLILHLDAVEKLSVSAKDMISGASTLDEYVFRSETVADGDVLFDDFYCISGGSSVFDFLGADGIEVFCYQNNTNSADADNGKTLDVGVWQSIGKTPGNTDEVKYTGGIGTGYMLCNDTVSGNDFRPGPSGGVPTIDGTPKAAKWLHQMKRSNGPTTVFYKRFGNDVDTPADPGTVVALTTSFKDFITVIEGQIVPASGEVFANGFGKDGGTRDLVCKEVWGFLLHQKPSAGGAIPVIMHNYIRRRNS